MEIHTKPGPPRSNYTFTYRHIRIYLALSPSIYEPLLTLIT